MKDLVKGLLYGPGGVLLVDERQAKGTFPFPLVGQAELIRDFQEDVQVPEGAPASRMPALLPPPGGLGEAARFSPPLAPASALPPSRAVAPPIKMRMSGARSGADESAVRVWPHLGPGVFCGLELLLDWTRKERGRGATPSVRPWLVASCPAWP